MRLTRRRFVRSTLTVASALPAVAFLHDAFGERKSTRKREPLHWDRALDWLVRHQEAEGHWSDESFVQRCTGEACTGITTKSVVASTANVLLAFEACLITHRGPGPHRAAFKMALEWMLSRQSENGSFNRGAVTAGLLDHVLASQSVVMAWGGTGHKVMKAPAQSAVDWTGSRQLDSGAWGADGDDAQATTQAVILLRSARMAELRVDDAVLARAFAWLARRADEDTGVIANDPLSTALYFAHRLRMPDEAHPRDDDPLVPKLAAHIGSLDISTLDGEALWLVTRAMHGTADDDAWTKWLEEVFKLAAELQSDRTGQCERGSFKPRGAEGRVTATAYGTRALRATQGYRRVFDPR